jgi:sugar phosphate isomerase/epimerase
MSYLAISDIGWTEAADPVVYRLMREKGFLGLETTPARVSGNVSGIRDADISEYRARVNGAGIQIVAMQALLYGRPELTIFEDKDTREATAGFLEKCIDIGAKLGASALVFGAPKNRFIPEYRQNSYLAIALDFFARIGKYAGERGLFFCLEPNPGAYGANFICTTQEAVSFVKTVGSRGLKVNLDTGTIIINNENYRDILDEETVSWLGHVHLSEPFLAPLDTSREIHRQLPDILRAAKYSGDISIEMKKVSDTDHRENTSIIEKALDSVKAAYGQSN